MDKFPEAFRRFEQSDVDISDVRDSNDLIRKFRYWLNRGTTTKQDECIRKEARRLGIKIVKPLGISERLEIPREKLKRHYTTHKVRGKTVMVARIPKGQKGAGRFAKRY